MRRQLYLLPLALLASCSVTRDNFTERYVDAYCEFRERCDKAEFFYDYDNRGDCLDKYGDYWRDYGPQRYDECDFSESEAERCLELLNQSCKLTGDDYDEFDPTCAEVWDCGSVYGE